ncbi:hypothetical protein ABFG93_07205 [Pseudalkalibacillus hwajinpoensis]|uniref:hypothetical protein n=1 Tax=Guptibacillus hwajinpoensis TaxID=208199 RepID=UPI00325C1DE5
MHEVEFEDSKLYEKEKFLFVDGHKASAIWLSIDEILSGKKTLYPDSLVSVLKNDKREE